MRYWLEWWSTEIDISLTVFNRSMYLSPDDLSGRSGGSPFIELIKEVL